VTLNPQKLFWPSGCFNDTVYHEPSHLYNNSKRNLWNKNQLDALFIHSLFRQSTSTCFEHICSPLSGGILCVCVCVYIYIYNNLYFFFTFYWPWISVYLSQYLTNLMHKICFTVSFISCRYMFRAHVILIRRSKLHYTASGIITPICVSTWWAHVAETCRGMK